MLLTMVSLMNWCLFSPAYLSQIAPSDAPPGSPFESMSAPSYKLPVEIRLAVYWEGAPVIFKICSVVFLKMLLVR